MSQKATLLHNVEAGFERYATEELLKALRARNFDAHSRKGDDDSIKESLSDPGALVIVAGGDGTVGKAARLLIDRNIPLAILPLGTANNIATSLGLCGDPLEIIAQMDIARKIPFDVGFIHGSQGESYFLESVGFGMFPHLIIERETPKEEEKQSREEELADALKHQLKILADYKAHGCTIHMDHQVIKGRYLMVEIMNTRFCGPNLNLAPHATPDDGKMDVVLVQESEREDFARYLTQCRKNSEKHPTLPVHRATKLSVTWEGKHYHIDDKPHEGDMPVTLKLQIKPGALSFLTGAKYTPLTP